MTKQVRRPVITFIFSVMTVILLAGCIVHVGANKANANISFGEDYSSVNKSLSIGEGKTIGDASTVNGKLSLADNVTAQEVSSVNGRLVVGESVNVDELSTVNGKLSAGKNFTSKGDVSTVNGKIELVKDSVVKGNVRSVNGKIDIDGVDIHQNIETVNGNVELNGNTRVRGDIIFERRNKNSYNKRSPVLRIEKGVQVDGNIILESPVDIEFEDEDLKNKVITKF